MSESNAGTPPGVSTPIRTPPRSPKPSGIVDRLPDLHMIQRGTRLEDEHLYSDFHSDFTKLFKGVEKKLDNLEETTIHIKALHSDAILAVQPEVARRQQDEIENYLDYCAAQFISVSKDLRCLQKYIELQDTKVIRDRRWLIVQYNVLFIQTQRQLEDFQNTCQRLSATSKAALKRRIRSRYGAITGTNRKTPDNNNDAHTDNSVVPKAGTPALLPPAGTPLNEQQIDSLAEQLITERRENAIYEESLFTLSRVENTHNEILSIERNIRELNRMFADLQLLVMEQDPYFEDVAENLKRATSDVEQGRGELKKAREYTLTHKLNRRCIIM